jgi:4-hydroxy-3-polyprenylbenzoate decarboxylase
VKRIVVAITGATGSIYGLRLLTMLKDQAGWETHLVMSQAALLNIREELVDGRRQFEEAADVVHSSRNVGASIASGSFLCEGMVIAPCSMRTLAAVANGLSDNLITRAADVMLKERRKLVLMTRETPLNLAHLRNMTACTEMGAVIFPPVPAFYNRPLNIDEIIDHSCMRVLDQFGLHRNLEDRWQGLTGENPNATLPLKKYPRHCAVACGAAYRLAAPKVRD